MKKKLYVILTVLIAVLGTSILSAAAPEVSPEEKATWPKSKVVGSWFGRAVPMDPWCEIGSAGCPVPPEITMLPTFFADGNFIGIDSQTFGGGAHTTAHGQWVRIGSKTIEANFVFLQSDATDTFVGGFRMRMWAESTGQHTLHGYINAWFFPFTDENGRVVVDPETGFPVPDPLQPLGDFIFDPAQCDPSLGCFGVFEFTVRRVAVN